MRIGWTSQDAHPDDYAEAWFGSWPALVCEDGEGAIIGFVRAITDGAMTVYVAELLVAPARRGRGVATALLDACHVIVPTARLDLLATADAVAFYERRGYRSLRGYRRSFR